MIGVEWDEAACRESECPNPGTTTYRRNAFGVTFTVKVCAAHALGDPTPETIEDWDA